MLIIGVYLYFQHTYCDYHSHARASLLCFHSGYAVQNIQSSSHYQRFLAELSKKNEIQHHFPNKGMCQLFTQGHYNYPSLHGSNAKCPNQWGSILHSKKSQVPLFVSRFHLKMSFKQNFQFEMIFQFDKILDIYSLLLK